MFKRSRRLFFILCVIWRHRRLILLLRTFLPKAWVWLIQRMVPADSSVELQAHHLRLALEELGPVFIKFGQALSTRRDLLAPVLANELALLQDQVPGIKFEHLRATLEQRYGTSMQTTFAQFDEQALASASVAQVHAAQLHDGREVVVKVLRPNIRQVIEQDIALLLMLARFVVWLWPNTVRLRPVEVVSQYETYLLDELNLLREAANGTELRRNFEGSKALYVPEIYWDYSHEDVLVMERIYGIPISNIQRMQAHGIDFKRLAETGVEVFFTQVFKHNFFHADMHPGNIFVDPSQPSQPQYIAVDFGIVGSLTLEDQRYLAENFHAFFNRDYQKVADLHIESGWVSPATNTKEFESAIRTVCEPIFDKPISQISFGQLLLHLFQTAQRFDMEVQPQLILLQKTLINIEGLGRQLYPDLDLWLTAKPFIQRWMDEQTGVRFIFKHFKQHLPNMLERLPEINGLVYEALKQYQQNHQISQRTLSKQEQQRCLEHKKRRGLFLGLGSLAVAIMLMPESLRQSLQQLEWPFWFLILLSVWGVLQSFIRKK